MRHELIISFEPRVRVHQQGIHFEVMRTLRSTNCEWRDRPRHIHLKINGCVRGNVCVCVCVCVPLGSDDNVLILEHDTVRRSRDVAHEYLELVHARLKHVNKTDTQSCCARQMTPFEYDGREKVLGVAGLAMQQFWGLKR